MADTPKAELPEPWSVWPTNQPPFEKGLYTADQMRAYAEAAAQARITALQAELERALIDARRYRWLRMQDWFDGQLCVLRDPKKVLTSDYGLGADCPSRGRLDAAIDAELASSDAGRG